MTDQPFKMIRCSGCGSEDACLCSVLGDSPMPPGYRKRLIEIGLLPADSPTPTGTGLSCDTHPSAPQTPEYGCTDCLKAGAAPGIAYAPGQGPPLPDIQLSVKKGPVRGDETKQLNELIHEFGELHHLNRQDDRMAANGFPNGITATMRREREEEARIAIHAHVSAAVQEAVERIVKADREEIAQILLDEATRRDDNPRVYTPLANIASAIQKRSLPHVQETE